MRCLSITQSPAALPLSPTATECWCCWWSFLGWSSTQTGLLLHHKKNWNWRWNNPIRSLDASVPSAIYFFSAFSHRSSAIPNNSTYPFPQEVILLPPNSNAVLKACSAQVQNQAASFSALLWAGVNDLYGSLPTHDILRPMSHPWRCSRLGMVLSTLI